MSMKRRSRLSLSYQIIKERGKLGCQQLKRLRNKVYPIQSRKLLYSIDLVVVAIVMASVIQLGNSLNGNAFWLDEIWRVDLILNPDLFNTYVEQPSAFTAITSPIFALLIKLFTLFLGVSPESIRLLLPISALLMSLLIYVFIRKYSPVLAAIAFSFIVFNPEIRYWTLEFKPYVFDALIFLTVFLTWLDLIISDSRNPRRIHRLFLIVSISLLSSVLTVFLLPAVLVSLVFIAKRNQLEIGSQRLIVLSSGLICQTILTYFVIWRYAKNDPGMQTFWSNGFYTSSDLSFLSFYLNALGEPFLSFIQLESTPATLLLGCWWITSFLLLRRFGTAISEKVRVFLLFIVVFFVTLIISNLFLFWPLGKIRVNLFINVFSVVLMCVGSLLIGKQDKFREFRNLNSAIVSCVLLSAIYQNSQLDILRPSPTYPQHVLNEFKDNGSIAIEIQESCKNSLSVIVLSPTMYYQVKYYSSYDDAYSSKLKILSSDCVNQIYMTQFGDINDKDKKQIRNILSSGGMAYWLLSGVSQDDIDVIRAKASLIGTLEELISIRDKGDGFFQLTQ